MSRVLRDFLVMFQRFSLTTGQSARHSCDMPIARTPDFTKRIASQKSRLAARDGDPGLLLGRFRRGTVIGEETVLLVEIIKNPPAARPPGRPKQLRVEMRDQLIKQYLRFARRDPECKWTTTQIVRFAVEYYRVPESLVYDLLKMIDAEPPSRGFSTCFATNSPSPAGHGVTDEDAAKMRARGWTDVEIERLRKARRPWGAPSST
jgi:hypothetical protein